MYLLLSGIAVVVSIVAFNQVRAQRREIESLRQHLRHLNDYLASLGRGSADAPPPVPPGPDEPGTSPVRPGLERPVPPPPSASPQATHLSGLKERFASEREAARTTRPAAAPSEPAAPHAQPLQPASFEPQSDVGSPEPAPGDAAFAGTAPAAPQTPHDDQTPSPEETPPLGPAWTPDPALQRETEEPAAASTAPEAAPPHEPLSPEQGAAWRALGPDAPDTEEPEAAAAFASAGGPSPPSGPGGTSGGPTASPESFEVAFGSTWLLRIGLVMLAIAVGLFSVVLTPRIGPGGKTALAYAGAIGLFVVGWFYRNRLQRFARPVMAGGLTLAFFVSFAAHFIEPMRCIPLVPSVIWMTAGIVPVFVLADRWKSEATAGLAVFLGHAAAFVAGRYLEDASYTGLVLILLLALGAAILLMRHNWFALSIFAVVASYGSHLLWVTLTEASAPPAVGFWFNFAFLTSYYAIFATADLLWWRSAYGTAQPAPAIAATPPPSEASEAAAGSSDASAESGDESESIDFSELDPGSEIDRIRAVPAADEPLARPISRLQEIAQLLGPINLCAYVGIVCALFFATDVFESHIHWFFFPIAAVQGLVALPYSRWRNPLTGFYIGVIPILLTLGFLSVFEGLALNLVLAAEALILLILGHVTRLRVFHFFSQAALAANFVHYWATTPSPAAAGPAASITFAVYLGGVGVAVVYFVKAHLETIWNARAAAGERQWREFGRESAFWRAALEPWRQFYAAVMPAMPWFHVAGGVLIFVNQSEIFLSLPSQLFLYAAAATLMLSAALIFGIAPYLLADAIFRLAVLAVLIDRPTSPFPPDLHWAVIVNVAIAPAGLALFCELFRRRTLDAVRFRLALPFILASLLIVFVTAFVALNERLVGDLRPMFVPWLASVALFYLAQERYSALALKRRGESPLFAPPVPLAIAGATAFFTTILLLRLVTLAYLDAAPVAVPYLLVPASLILIAVAGWRRDLVFYASGMFVLLALYAILAVDRSFRGAVFATPFHPSFIIAATFALAWIKDFLLTYRYAAEADGSTTTPPDSLRPTGEVIVGLTWTIGFVLLGYTLERFTLPFWWLVALGGSALALTAATVPFRLRAGFAVALLVLPITCLLYLIQDRAPDLPTSVLAAAFLLLAASLILENVAAALPDDRFVVRPLNRTLLQFWLILPPVLACMLALYRSSHVGPQWTTGGWGLLAVVLIVIGVIQRKAAYRRIALGLIAVSILRVFLVDLRDLERLYQAAAFLVLGLCLVGIGWLYTRYAARLREWL